MLRAVGLLGPFVVFGPIFYCLYQRTVPKLYDRSESEPSAYAYPAASGPGCEAGSRTGPAGGSTGEETPEGIRYTVRAPTNYDPTRRHPLVVVFAPHDAGRYLSERYVGLTRSMTGQGFVLAYTDFQGIDRRALAALAKVPEAVARRWCIDESRIFYTGHSDGGTTATALVVLGLAKPKPAAIAPSAAGFRGEDLASYACPAPQPVLVLHGQNDDLFPGFGREAAGWWARCNRCAASPRRRADGCDVYTKCDADVPTVYCEGSGRHIDWPGRNDLMIEFFRSAPPRPGG